MALQRFTVRLTQLRCILESDPGPSEPYLWVTLFRAWAGGAAVPDRAAGGDHAGLRRLPDRVRGQRFRRQRRWHPGRLSPPRASTWISTS